VICPDFTVIWTCTVPKRVWTTSPSYVPPALAAAPAAPAAPAVPVDPELPAAEPPDPDDPDDAVPLLSVVPVPDA
jgi:hypothetical protein